MSIHMTLPTDDLRIAFDLISADGSLGPGSAVEVPGGGRLRFEGARRQGTGPISLAFEVERGAGSAAALAHWIAERLAGRVPVVRIDRSEVRVDEEELRRALETRLGAGT
jgi:hypothetical protein